MMSNEQLQKIRSENLKVLEDQGLVVNPNLPLLEVTDSVRSIEEIGMRINLLHIFYTISLEGVESLKFFADLIKKEGWEKYLSQNEKKFLLAKNIGKQELIDFSWCKESAFALLWSSCSRVKADKIQILNEVDISDYYSFIPPELELTKFLQLLKIRDIALLYKALDLYYNLHWIAKRNKKAGPSLLSMLSLSSRKKTGLNESLIRERRRALEWVIYSNLDWDNVTLDT